ncbi:MAG: YceD family protein [Gammaproteobacteria bacterium]|nr:YceD family protein [Gammaproteobacteria bacterium]
MASSPIPLLVDHLKLAREAAEINGHVPLKALTRMAQLIQADKDNEVSVRLTFRMSASQDYPEVACVDIKGHLAGKVSLTCQNCLEPLWHGITLPYFLQVVSADAVKDLQAKGADKSLDLLVWATEQPLALVELIEDELMLDLPMIPRHQDCVLPESAGAEENGTVTLNAGTVRNQPFAGLKQILNEQEKE